MRTLSGVMTVGRPSLWPRARAASRPSWVPSTMSSRMNSSKGGEHLEDQPSARGGGVELFVQRSEPDVVAAQVGHDGDQVLQGAAEPGQLGDHEGVAFEEVFESFGQAWADGVFAGELVAVDALAAGFGQGVDLAVEVLVAPAGAGVTDQVSSGGGEQAGFGFDGCHQPLLVVRKRCRSSSQRTRLFITFPNASELVEEAFCHGLGLRGAGVGNRSFLRHRTVAGEPFVCAARHFGPGVKVRTRPHGCANSSAPDCRGDMIEQSVVPVSEVTARGAGFGGGRPWAGVEVCGREPGVAFAACRMSCCSATSMSMRTTVRR